MESVEYVCDRCRSMEHGVGQLPGYRGYCPQLKYNFGKTFGQQTSELSKLKNQVDEDQPQSDFRSIWESRRQLSTNLEERRRIVALGLMTDHSSRQDAPALYTGDSTRYDKGMIPGYTGYIPRWQFKFGKTYKDECNACLGEFDAMQQIKDCDKMSALAYPRPLRGMDAIASDDNVREYLNEIQNSGYSKYLDAVPPIPGYKGFIPHVRTSDVGLGSRFHNMAIEGYDALYAQRAEQEEQKHLASDADSTKVTLEPANTHRKMVKCEESNISDSAWTGVDHLYHECILNELTEIHLLGGPDK